MKKHLGTLACALAIFSFSTRSAADNPSREFLMSCTYGVITGTLVGVASLAFTKNPADHLNYVARGASLGLYAGIFLGLYVVYIVPGLDAKQEEDQLPQVGSFGPTFDMEIATRRTGPMDNLATQFVVAHF